MAAKLGWINLALLVCVLGGMFVQQTRLDRLEEHMATLSQPGPAKARARQQAMPSARIAPIEVASRASAPESDGTDVAAVDDHLWSDDGREAIRDVVEERDAEERDRMRERWEQMREYRVTRVVDDLAEALQLSDADQASLQALLSDYSAARSTRWQRMRDDDFDPAAFEAEMEEARSTMEDGVEAVIGADGLAALQERMQGRRPF
ncbi:MAG: hypothetical protein AAF211_28200 [Myxococcota bacterium]